jgi:putative two-component system response regulator
MFPFVRPMRATILVVDDEELTRDLIERILRDRGFLVRSVSSTADANVELASGTIDLMLCDVVMPDESGTEFLSRLRSDHPELPVVMVTGIANTNIAQVALELGAYGYVTKPFSAGQLVVAVTNALHRRASEREDRASREHLDTTRLEQDRKLHDALDDLEIASRRQQRSSEATIVALARAIEGRDVGVGNHAVGAAKYARLVAEGIGLPANVCDLIAAGTLVHDVGKVGVPTDILLKPGPLSNVEYEVVKQHAELGYRILSSSDEPSLMTAATIAWTHHERWDGSGYPRGLERVEIPIEGRIAAVADVFDALVSPWEHRAPIALDVALGIMRKGRGIEFDPEVLDAFLHQIAGDTVIPSQA